MNASRSTHTRSHSRSAALAIVIAGSLLGVSPAPAPAQTGSLSPMAGLWLGEITLDSARHLRTGSQDATVGTAQLRMILHVDGAGKVRLLKDALVAKRAGSNTLLLFTEPARLATQPVETTSATDPTLKAQRYSTAAYDFQDTDGTADGALELTGSLGSNLAVEGTLQLPATHPTNPFRHKFHPDHANTGATAITVTRALKLQFGAEPEPTGAGLRFAATYQESIGGLHRSNLVVQGSALFTRVSTVATLNP